MYVCSYHLTNNNPIRHVNQGGKQCVLGVSHTTIPRVQDPVHTFLGKGHFSVSKHATNTITITVRESQLHKAEPKKIRYRAPIFIHLFLAQQLTNTGLAKNYENATTESLESRLHLPPHQTSLTLLMDTSLSPHVVNLTSYYCKTLIFGCP